MLLRDESLDLLELLLASDIVSFNGKDSYLSAYIETGITRINSKNDLALPSPAMTQ